MTLQETQLFLENLLKQTSRKRQLKIYQDFLHTIRQLQERDFTKEEIQSIETELESLNFNTTSRTTIRQYRKSFSKFETFLKNHFSLTSKEYYTKLGLSLGTSFGLLFGVIALSSFERSMGIGIGMMAGMFIGLTIGKSLDAKAISEGKAL